jgi:hypothetical protein
MVLCPQGLPSVALILWPFLHYFEHPWASAVSVYVIQASGGSGLPSRDFATHGARPLPGSSPFWGTTK